jgi:hypothetical protein
MKNSYKLALLTVLGLTSVTAAQAYTSGDLLIGVYQPGVANTEVLDLGSLATLTSEGSVDLTSALASAGFSTTLSSSAEFGVLGAVTSGNGTVNHNTYLSTPGTTPPTIANFTSFGTSKAPIVTLGNNPGAQGVGSGPDYFSSITIGDGGIADALGGFVTQTSVTGTADLFTIADNGSAPVLDGTLSLSPTSEVLTFTAVPVPEPAAYGLLAGAGLLIVSLRNKLRSKKA